MSCMSSLPAISACASGAVAVGRGVVEGVDDEAVTIKLPDAPKDTDPNHRLPLVLLAEAKLVMTDALMNMAQADQQEHPIDDDEHPPLEDDERIVHRLVARLLEDDDQIIVFTSRRHDARRIAEMLAERLRLPPAHTAQAALPRGDKPLLRELLHRCLDNGVAFHTAELDPAERTAVETAFGQTREVRVIVCTATLAQGVNLPAGSVIVHGLHGRDGGLPVEEYKNMAGRAGRTGRPLGRSFIVLDDEAREQSVWRSYVTGRPGKLKSRLFDRPTDLRPVVLAALSDAIRWYDRIGRLGVEEFLASSFAAHQARRAFPSGEHLPLADVAATVAELREAEMIRVDGSRLEMAPLGNIAYRSGLGIDAVTAIARVLRLNDRGALNAATLICLLHLADDTDDLFFPSDRANRGIQDSVARYMQDEQHVAPSVLKAFRNENQNAYVPRLLTALVCVKWTRGVPASHIESSVSGSARRKRRPIPVAQIAKRAADRIETVLDIAREVCSVAELGTLARTLPVQLEFGVPEAQVDLARQVGGAIGRSEYQRLHLSGLHAPDDVLGASDEQLLECLNHDHGLVRRVREGAEHALEEARAESQDAAAR